MKLLTFLHLHLITQLYLCKPRLRLSSASFAKENANILPSFCNTMSFSSRHFLDSGKYSMPIIKRIYEMFETDPLFSAIIYNCQKGKNRHEHTTYMSKSARPKKNVRFRRQAYKRIEQAAMDECRITPLHVHLFHPMHNNGMNCRLSTAQKVFL